MMIKVCGMREPEQISELKAMDVDFAGLIFYTGSRRFVNYSDEELQSLLKKNDIKRVGVFVNEDVKQVLRICRDFDLYAAQLHGDEDVDFCKTVKAYVKLIKVFRLEGNENVDVLTAPFTDAADYFLFDSGKGGYGGTGIKFNWNMLLSFRIGKPFFLSGGIGPEDVGLIRSFNHPYFSGIDLNSRFEIQAGKKDISRLETFINELRKTGDHGNQ